MTIKKERVLELVEKLREVAKTHPLCDMMGVWEEFGPVCHACLCGKAINGIHAIVALPFTGGRESLAQFLGFNDSKELRVWAGHNPDIWGYDHGYTMFGLGLAFGQPSNVFPTTVLADHWEAVAGRLE
jgi:hypothetical protein